MEQAAVLLDSRFEKSLPKERQEELLEKVSNFAKDYFQYKNQKERLLKYGIDKVEGCAKLKEVWKFKVSKGERVLFIKGKDIEWDTYAYQDALVFLEFCDHDAQIRRARSMGWTGEITDIEDYVDEVARELEYEPEKNITRVFKHIDITTLVHSEDLTGIYYLNKDQRHFVNEQLRPLMLFGSAGSGKTTIGIYKVFALLKQYPDLRIGYFTYSNHLLETARKIFNTVVENEIISEEKLQADGLDFYNIRDFLIDHTKASQMVELSSFRVFYRGLLSQPKYKKFVRSVDAFDAWREIRGLIKGFAGMDWSPQVAQPLIEASQYRGLKALYTSLEGEDKEMMYEIAQRYQDWLEKEGKVDENDLCRKLLAQQDQLPEYDWIVIDEVQDLTELEIYLMYSMVWDKENVLVSGDFYQTINPTFFDTRRMSTLLELSGERYEQYPQLTMNYRNPRQIVEAANKLADYRQSLFGKDRRNDLGHEVAMREEEGQIYVLSNNPKEKLRLLREALTKAYVYVVVPNELEKQKLMEELGVDSRIFTVAEVKGIENEQIICVNLFTAYKEKWEKVTQEERVKESSLYKYLFNMIYVAMTRAKEYVCFVDDNVPMGFYELFLKQKMICDTFDPVVFQFEKASSEEDFYRYAYKLEEMENFEAAMKEYEALALPEAQVGIKRCQAALLRRQGAHLEAAALYEAISAHREAIRCYKLGGETRRQYQLMLSHMPRTFLKEVVANPAIDYEQGIKPFIETGVLQAKMAEVCLVAYGKKLGEVTPYKEFEIEEVQSLTMRMQTLNERMEGMIRGRSTDGLCDQEN
ncbi:MAG: UvrD-helicase domain-containing protein [Cellulosilyticaceae bacterium]